jgi:hypothetical protein
MHLTNFLLSCSLLLAGCGGTQLVKVEVPTKIHPPADLVEPLSKEHRPTFVYPNDSGASSCLTPEGERQLRELFLELLGKYEALRAWAID